MRDIQLWRAWQCCSHNSRVIFFICNFLICVIFHKSVSNVVNLWSLEENEASNCRWEDSANICFIVPYNDQIWNCDPLKEVRTFFFAVFIIGSILWFNYPRNSKNVAPIFVIDDIKPFPWWLLHHTLAWFFTDVRNPLILHCDHFDCGSWYGISNTQFSLQTPEVSDWHWVVQHI